jgi:hypothetical protein
MTGPLVVITSKAHIPRMRAHKILLENDYDNFVVVVDNAEQASRCIHEAGIPIERIHQTGKPADLPPQDGIAFARQYIEDHIVPRGEWYVSLDDNVGGWTWLPYPWQELSHIDFSVKPDTPEPTTWRKLYETPCSFPVVVAAWENLIHRCEFQGTQAGGFAIETNYFYRGTKWQRLGYVRAQNAVWKNTGLPFYYWRGAMLEDFIRSVDVVARCGSVLINRFVKPQKQFFEAGGIGTFEERRPNLVACSNEILARWPGLTRQNKGQDYQLTFALRGSRLDDWRRTHGYL